MLIRGAAFLFLSLLAFGPAFGQSGPEPWEPGQVLTPDEFAKTLQKSGTRPAIFMVGPRILYNGDHITGAVFAGPAGSEQGLALLKQQAAKLPANAEIVLYCGCCPMERCPNIRPAFRALHEAGFSHVKIISIPTNLHADWTEKGYPVEKGAVPLENSKPNR